MTLVKQDLAEMEMGIGETQDGGNKQRIVDAILTITPYWVDSSGGLGDKNYLQIIIGGSCHTVWCLY